MSKKRKQKNKWKKKRKNPELTNQPIHFFGTGGINRIERI